jgi:hypothetical protein
VAIKPQNVYQLMASKSEAGFRSPPHAHGEAAGFGHVETAPPPWSASSPHARAYFMLYMKAAPNILRWPAFFHQDVADLCLYASAADYILNLTAVAG